MDAQADWIADDWDPGVRVLWLGTINPEFSNWVAFTITNVDGVVFYLRMRMPTIPTVLLVAAFALKDQIAKIGNEMLRELKNGLDPIGELAYQYRLQALVFASLGLAWGLAAANSSIALIVSEFHFNPQLQV